MARRVRRGRKRSRLPADLRAAARWLMNHPDNRDGTDKSWVIAWDEGMRRLFSSARRVRR
jgi:hypothetical protein